MRKAGLFALCSLAATICLCWLYIGGCSDNRVPNDADPPDNSTGEPKDYVVYFHDGGAISIDYYGYHTVTGALDSFTLPVRAQSAMQITSDGSTFYIPDTSSIAVIDIESRSKTAELPYRHTRYIALSPDDRYLAIINDDSLVILNTVDYSTVFSDTAEVGSGVFTGNGEAFYGVEPGDLSVNDFHRVYRLDLTASPFTVTKKQFTKSLVSRIVPSADESLWFMFLGHSFAVYDVDADSIIFSDHLPAAAGHIKVAPDGQNVFYSYPGGSFMDPFIPSSFRVYDVAVNQRLPEVEVYQVWESEDTTKFPVWQMAVTPDSRLLVCNASMGGWGGIIVVDVARLEIVKHLPISHIQVWGLTVQSSK